VLARSVDAARVYADAVTRSAVEARRKITRYGGPGMRLAGHLRRVPDGLGPSVQPGEQRLQRPRHLGLMTLVECSLPLGELGEIGLRTALVTDKRVEFFMTLGDDTPGFADVPRTELEELAGQRAPGDVRQVVQIALESPWAIWIRSSRAWSRRERDSSAARRRCAAVPSAVSNLASAWLRAFAARLYPSVLASLARCADRRACGSSASGAR
jgi:hypothetical protein